MFLQNLLKKIKSYWIAFIIPSIVLVFSFFLKMATGPYWQFPDPSYGNLISSLSIVKNLSPIYVTSPGTPLQILGAVIIYVLNFGRSTPEMVHRALVNPEFYLNAIYIVLTLLIFGTSLILGIYVYRQTQDKLAVLLSQFPTLLLVALRSFSFYDYVPPVMVNISPEPLLISISSLFNLLLLKLFFAKKKQEEKNLTILLGFICGLGTAAKFTFSFFALLPLILCRRWMKLLFVVVTVLSLVLWTIPMIPSYAWFWKLLVKFSTHVGVYGYGERGFVNLPQYWLDWQSIFCRYKTLILLAGTALLFRAGQVIYDKKISRETTFFLATALCILVQFALVAKHYDEHYLVSVVNLFGSLFVLFYLHEKNRNFFFKTVVFLSLMICSIQAVGQATTYHRQLSEYTKDAVSFNKMIHTKYPAHTLIGVIPMPMATPEAAFFLANDWDNNQEDELASLYPKSLAHLSNNINIRAIYTSGIYSIKQRVWADDLLAAGVPVLFIAPKNYDFSQTPYTVELLEQGRYAGAFQLLSSTEKQADQYFQAALKLTQEGYSPQALVLALKSRDFHYQPIEKINYLITVLYHSLKEK